MRGKKQKLSLLCVIVLLFGFAGTAVGDWDEGDSYKMHYPQLPKEGGWNVTHNTPSGALADDWQCTETGPVSDIHFWASWIHNDVDIVEFFRISIYSDRPDPDGSGPEHSEPNELLWDRYFYTGDFTVRSMPPDLQGWYDPTSPPSVIPQDHDQWCQINITDINNPFIQQEGEIYWLCISDIQTSYGSLLGWKESDEHFNDDAVYGIPIYGWNELVDPCEGTSMDLAFVITTEEEPNQPTIKYVQQPDLSNLGMDVDATYDASEPPWPNQILADDFNCTTTGPITDIHIWGSWYHDGMPYGGPGGVSFTLSIHEDDPAGPGGTDPCNLYSQPGVVLWSKYFGPDDFEVYEEANELMEGYYVPCSEYYEPFGDSACWRYDFYILPLEAFEQQGDPCNPVIYWLDVQVDTTGQEARFGWKTSPDHWMDDAVYAVGIEGDHSPWEELRYPEGHPYYPNSIDLAFAITTQEWPEPKPVVPHLKWSQPPVEIDPMAITPTYCGWDEPSLREWIEPLYFPCWDCPTQCYGDTDCDTDVDANDLLSFTAANGSMYGDPDYDPCADFDRDFDVDGDDGNILWSWIGRIIPSDCPEEGDAPDPQSWWVVADDFRCLGTMPVTSIHWWGSHVGWDGNEPPQPEPIAWRIGFWSNIRDPDPCDPFTFSYPRHLLWQIEVPADRVDVNNVGQDYFPDESFEDTCFQYYVDLEPNEYFWQSDFEPNTMDSIFWLSIAAVYPVDVYTDFPWGWKTRPWHWMDDAVTFQLGEDPYPGMPPLNLESNNVIPLKRVIGEMLESYDVSFELDTDPNYIKWEQAYDGIRRWPHYEDMESAAFEYEYSEPKYSQYPDLAPTGMDVLAGPSMDPCGPPGSVYEKFLADDFLCTASGPITDIYLYTSYNQDVRYDEVPWFSLVIYENVPADACVPYSRPGQVLWEAYLAPTAEWIDTYGVEESFYDPNPDLIIGGDTQVWLFYFEIDPNEAFVQEEGKIYWLGVHHSFDFDGDGLVTVTDVMTMTGSWPAGLFGWKTSLDHFEDDAVWTDVDTFATGNPHVAPSGEIWNELRYPSGHPYEGNSIDLAFELGSKTRGTEIISLVADDWRCERRTPVTAISWWGSYVGYSYEPCTGYQPILPVKPDYFLLNIWTDVPASNDVGGSGNCCSAHPWPGCNDPCCEASVCSYDPYCCDTEWDEICVNEAINDPNCDCGGLPYSHPGRKVWEYKAYDYDEVLVGYDKYPEDEPPYRTEPVFRYSVRLPEENWFCQPDVNSIYWLSIVAVYVDQFPEYLWGWTNHEHVFNDDAVIGWPEEPKDPEDNGADEWEWYELFDQTGASEDMSFMLFTDPNKCVNCADYNTDFIVNFVDYADFADDWRWTGPSGGYNNSDLDCSGVVNFYDLRIFAMQWLQSCP